MDDSDSKELSELFERFKLMPATVAKLEDSGFINILAFSLLDTQTIDELPVNPAQKLLLKAAVKSAATIQQGNDTRSTAAKSSAVDEASMEHEASSEHTIPEVLNVLQTLGAAALPEFTAPSKSTKVHDLR